VGSSAFQKFQKFRVSRRPNWNAGALELAHSSVE
jgi:hypothetical protein